MSPSGLFTLKFVVDSTPTPLTGSVTSLGFDVPVEAFSYTCATSGFPALNLIRLPHDHTGNYTTALARINSPELEVADNDYAMGLVINKIAHSAYAGSTLIFSS